MVSGCRLPSKLDVILRKMFALANLPLLTSSLRRNFVGIWTTRLVTFDFFGKRSQQGLPTSHFTTERPVVLQ
jgi:hypothetical protein